MRTMRLPYLLQQHQMTVLLTYLERSYDIAGSHT
jgi:hypothetical protein